MRGKEKYYIERTVLIIYAMLHLLMAIVHEPWFDEAEADYNDFIKALLRGNRKEMNIFMNRLTIQMFSYFDTQRGGFGKKPERFYHGFVLGLLVELDDMQKRKNIVS